jgi:hypothetical protein
MGEYVSEADISLYDTPLDGATAPQISDTAEKLSVHADENDQNAAPTDSYDTYPPEQTEMLEDYKGAVIATTHHAEQFTDVIEPAWPPLFKDRICPEAETIAVPDPYSSRILDILKRNEAHTNMPAHGERPHLSLTADTPHGKATLALYKNNDLLLIHTAVNEAGETITVQQGYYISASRYDSELVICADESGYLDVPEDERMRRMLDSTDTTDRAIGREEWEQISALLDIAEVEQPSFEDLWNTVQAYETEIPSAADSKDGAIELKRYISKGIAAAPARQVALNIHQISRSQYNGMVIAEPEPDTDFQNSIVQYTVSSNSIDDALDRDVGGPYVSITHIRKITEDGSPATDEEKVAGEESRAMIIVAEQRGEVSCVLYSELRYGEEEVTTEPVMLRVDKQFVRALRDFLNAPTI